MRNFFFHAWLMNYIILNLFITLEKSCLVVYINDKSFRLSAAIMVATL